MRINPKVVSDRFEDEVVVVSLETGCYYSLRNMSVYIWLLIEAHHSTSSIIKLLNISSDQEQDVRSLLDFLKTENLISEDDGTVTHDYTDSIPEFTKIEYSKFDDMADLIMIDPIHESDEQKGWPNKAS